MKMKTDFGVPGQLALVAGFFALSYILRGFVLRKLWLWFLSPWLPPPSLAVAIGIVTIGGLFGNTFERFMESSQDENEQRAAYRGGALLSCLFVRPIAVWIFGYVVHLFVQG